MKSLLRSFARSVFEAFDEAVTFVLIGFYLAFGAVLALHALGVVG